MAKLSKTHKERLTKLVESIPVENASFGFIGTSELLYLERSLLDAVPWKELLTPYDLYSALNNRLRRFEKRLPPGYSGTLGGVPDSALREQLWNDFKHYLESLPRRYFVYFEMRHFPSSGVSELPLCPDFSLIDTKCISSAAFLRTANALLAVTDSTELNKLCREAVYLRFTVTGYGDYGADTIAFQRGLAKFKHFIVAGLLKGVISSERIAEAFNYGLGFDAKPPADAFIHYADDDDDEYFRVSLSTPIARFLQSLRIDESKSIVFHGPTILSSNPAITREEKNEGLPFTLSFPLSFVTIDDEERDAQRLRAAMEWYFDAEHTENETIAFLQRCIGIEALLGDDKGEDVVSRLAERYAYLLGDTPSAREKLSSEFKTTYKQRSEIVHGRSARLPSGDGHNALFNSRRMLAELIWKEATTLVRVLRNRKEQAQQQPEAG